MFTIIKSLKYFDVVSIKHTNNFQEYFMGIFSGMIHAQSLLELAKLGVRVLSSLDFNTKQRMYSECVLQTFVLSVGLFLLFISMD